MTYKNSGHQGHSTRAGNEQAFGSLLNISTKLHTGKNAVENNERLAKWLF